MFQMPGRVVVVTGATRGLGRAMAREFAQAEARVVLVGRSTDASPNPIFAGTLDELATELRGRGADVLPIQADLSKLDDTARVVDETLAWAGRCDTLVCNASFTPAGGFLDIPARRWTLGWNITVMSSVLLCQGFLPGMLERKSGTIVTIGSESARYSIVPAADWAPRPDGYGEPLLYGTTKSALERMTVGLHNEFGARGVAFVNVRAGEMTTDGYHYMSSQVGMDGPTDHIHSPEEVAESVLWLTQQGEDISGHVVDFEDLEDRGALTRK